MSRLIRIIAVACFIAGVGAWLWWGQWQWAIVGAVVLVVLAVTDGLVEARKRA